MSSARVKQIKGDTPGSILFIGAGGQGSEDNSNLFWDISNSRLGILTPSPGSTFHIEGDTDVNLFRVDNSTSSVSIGTNPVTGRKLYIGGSNSSASLYALNNSTTSGSNAILVNHGGAASIVKSLQVIASAATGTGYAVDALTNSPNATTNIGGRFQALNATNNYALIVPNGGGAIGLGTSVPTALLHVDGSFRLGNLTTTPAAGYVLQSTDALGNVDWALAGADTNFANTNLTLTGPRTHNTNGNLLTISSDGGFAESSFNMTSSVIQLGNGGSYVNYSASGILMRVNSVLRISIQTAATVINDQGGDYDFRIEGQTDASLFSVDASADMVGIGTASPTAKLQVAGTVRFSALGTTPTVGDVLQATNTNGTLGWVTPAGGDGIYDGNGVVPSSTGVQLTNTINFELTASGNSTLFIDGTNDRIGMGFSNPTQTLSVDGNIFSTGGTAIEDNTAHGKVPYPGGGFFNSTAATQTGALEITVPATSAANMFSFWVDIMEYASRESMSVFISGYFASKTNIANSHAMILTTKAGKDYTVRTGGDGVNNKIWIGEIGEEWNYPQVTIRDFQAGWNTNPENYIDGWSIGFEAVGFDTVGATINGNLPIAGGDGDGIYDGSGTVPAATTVTLSSYLKFNASNLLYLDGTNNRIGIGTSNPTQAKLQLLMSGDDAAFGMYNFLSGVSSATLSIGHKILNLKTGSTTANIGVFAHAERNVSAGGRNIGGVFITGSQGWTIPNGNVAVLGHVASTMNPAGVTSWAGKFVNQSTSSPIKYGIEIDVTGTSPGSTSYGIDIAHQNVGTTGHGIKVDVTGANTTSYGIHLSVSGGTTNKAIYVQDGETDLGGAFATRVGFGTLLTADTNNWVPPERAFVRMSANAAWDLTGMTGGRDGRRILIVNTGNTNITFTHQSINSTAANRFLFTDSTNRVLVFNGVLEFIYDSSTQRWRHIGGTV